MQRFIYIFFFSLSISFTSWAQSDNDRAKAYYYEAATEYEKANYRDCLTYCDRVEEILGNSNARIEVLRIKAFFELGEMAEAQRSMDRLSSFPADETLRSEVLPLIVRIEEAERERIHKEKEAEAARQVLIGKAVFADGLGLVKQDGKAGFINERGEIIVPIQYDDALAFNHGTALVKSAGKWGMVSKTGNEVIKPRYESLSAFDADGLAYYTQKSSNREWPWEAGVIGRSGEFVGSIGTKTEQFNKGYIFRWVAHWLIEDNSSKENYEKAISLYDKVTPGNIYYSDCQLALGNIYYSGEGVIRDYKKALDHYIHADEKMATSNWALKERIGDMFLASGGTTVDKEKALTYYRHDDFSNDEVKDLSMKYMLQAADLGHFDAALSHLEQVKAHLDKESERFGEADKLYYVAGYIYEQQGNTSEAKKMYRRAARLFKERTYGEKARERLKAL